MRIMKSLYCIVSLLLIVLLTAACDTPPATAIPTHVLPTVTSTAIPPTVTCTPEPTATPKPTLTPTPKPDVIPPSLKVDVSTKTLKELSAVSKATKDVKAVKRYTADQVYKAMGIGEPYLERLYKAFFDGNWKLPMWPSTEYRGLGVYTMTEAGKEPALHTAVGLLYGVVPDTPAEAVTKIVSQAGISPRPHYLILQIRPGAGFTPDRNPEAFVVVRMGAAIYGGQPKSTAFALTTIDGSQLKTYNVPRVIDKEENRTSRLTDVWTVEEYAEAFGLRKYGIILVQGMGDNPGEASASWFYIFVLELPSKETQQRYSFSVTQ